MSLQEQDRRAVDILLDRSTVATSGIGTFGGQTPANQDRIQGAQQILQLLDLMPAADPPSDLLSRTLRRIEESAGRPASAAEAIYGSASHRPLA